jgi:D-beta-D-heptose 7-phosphate kinase/D-beta-D-heptose 1-phosphate adenosyltransferase
MPQQKQYKILLIGDSCTDQYVYGKCERLNPEAPVPVLNYTHTTSTMGMAWNVRNNIMSFGCEVYLLTQEEKIVKTRYIDEKSNQQILRVDNEPLVLPFNYDLPNQEEFDALVISDYNKGFLTKQKMFELVDWFKGPIFIDSKKTVLPVDSAYIKINDEEYKKLKFTSPNLIVTKGSQGAEYQGKLYPGEKVSTFDVCGAGDTFLSALVVFYLDYGRIEDAIPYANKAASIAVQHQGTYVLTEEDINEVCR